MSQGSYDYASQSLFIRVRMSPGNRGVSEVFTSHAEKPLLIRMPVSFCSDGLARQSICRA